MQKQLALSVDDIGVLQSYASLARALKFTSRVRRTANAQFERTQQEMGVLYQKHPVIRQVIATAENDIVAEGLTKLELADLYKYVGGHF